MLIKDVLLKTRMGYPHVLCRAKAPFLVFNRTSLNCDSPLLVLKGTSLSSVNALSTCTSIIVEAQFEMDAVCNIQSCLKYHFDLCLEYL